jgi:signal transduction histidine kinase
MSIELPIASTKRKTRHRYAEILAELPLPFLRSDANGFIVLANSAAMRLLGPDLIGKKVSELYGVSQEVFFNTPQSVKKALANAPNYELQNVAVPIRFPDGSSQDMLCSFVWNVDDDCVDCVLVPQVKELERSLGRVAKSLVYARRLEDTLMTITHEAVLLCNADRSYIKLADASGKWLVFKALFSRSGKDALPTDPSPITRGMTGLVFTTKEFYISRDVRCEPSHMYYSIFKDTISKVVVPLVRQEIDGREICYGVISVDGKAEGQFTSDTVEVLTTLAQHASIALAQAKHFHEVREDYDHLLKEIRNAQDVRGVRNLLHDGKNLVRNVVYELESIADDLAETSFYKKKAKNLHKRLDGLRALNDLMQELLEQMKGKPQERETEDSVHLRGIALRAMHIMPYGDETIDFQVAPEDKTYKVYGRPTQLLLVLYNLMTNALNAIKRTKRSGRIEVSISATPNRPDFVRLIIVDDGPGLPRAALEFIRFGESYSGFSGGTGLGLLTVRETVRNLNGSLEVESKFGGGAKFIIDLPGYPEETD